MRKEKIQILREVLVEQRKTRFFKILINLILILGAVIMLLPLLWMLATALTPNTRIPPVSLIPKSFTFENFVEAWNFPSAFSYGDNKVTMGTFFKNSLISTTFITVFGIIVDSLAAYVLAFKTFPGKKLFYYLALSTLMIPVYVTLVPEYLIIVKLGWANTYQALIVPLAWASRCSDPVF